MTLPNGAPAPVAATYTLATDTWAVKFNQLLNPGALDVSNWILRLNNFTITELTALASGRFVTGTASKIAGPASPNDVEYAPPPPDLMSRLSVDAPAFAAFPLVGV